jgi:hypothetical protein
LGKAKRLDHRNVTKDDSNATKEKRSAYACWPAKAVAVDEGSLGSKKKNRSNEVSY